MNKIVPDFTPPLSKRCLSGAFSQVLSRNGTALSEEMAFGLASALDFYYSETKKYPIPFISGRIKNRDFEKNLSLSADIEINTLVTKSAKKARIFLEESLDKNEPVIIYAGKGYLDYFELPDERGFAGHAFVVFGIGSEAGGLYISDLAALGRESANGSAQDNATNSGLFPGMLEIALGPEAKAGQRKLRLLKIGGRNFGGAMKDSILIAINKNAESMLRPKNKNYGLKGINEFKNRLGDWESFESGKLKKAAFNAHSAISGVNGGGGFYRNLYGGFLIEASNIFRDTFFNQAGKAFKNIASQWAFTGSELKDISEGQGGNLRRAQNQLSVIHIKESELWARIEEHIKWHYEKN